METITVPAVKPRPARVLQWVLITAIAIVLNLFFNYSIHLFYPEPRWDDFCQQEQVTIEPRTQAECVARGGAWREMNAPENIPFTPGLVERPVAESPKSYCDLQFTCRQAYEDKHAVYNRNVFVALVALGLLSIIVGFVAAAAAPVSFGLSLGGVLSLIVGSVRYWSEMHDYLRVIVLALALAVLIWLGVKKFHG